MGQDRPGAAPPADDAPGTATLALAAAPVRPAATPGGPAVTARGGELVERAGGAPTLEDVARVAGVSRATVSRVVNGKRRVAPHIQDVVREAIATVGYVPNLAARSLVTRRTGAVVVVVSGAEEAAADGRVSVDFADPFFGRVVGGMLRALRPRDVDPILMLAETDVDRARVISALSNGNADGALLVSTHGDDPLPGLLVEAGMPAVRFARPARPLPMSYVDVANRDGARLAAAHLVERGRRRVAVISGPLDVPSAQDRLSGFQDEMARHGHAWIPVATGNFTYGSGITAMAELLDQDAEIDAVFASNDLMALGAIETLTTRGRRVPEDVAVVGFDDSSLGAHSRPGLTSVRQPIEEMAAEMARILLDVLADPERRVTSVIFEPTLVVRGTS
ncbi:LacI family DNA-binding transcriptional regulator [Cellulomonas sp. PhB150]|uniref:LacI family DNA-binding transcriptional regulator n=1 Tax=Cellulomonas sp. PhB150 TaxID=2485188 RepID=UPI000F498DC7|nr:LacI family DNA-binding transcriptional regulator [Cellulomonas sp. PhB150]ROS31809.1 LacI family transcriptional regulator [Cellulomonas sp. PhB150]